MVRKDLLIYKARTLLGELLASDDQVGRHTQKTTPPASHSRAETPAWSWRVAGGAGRVRLV